MEKQKTTNNTIYIKTKTKQKYHIIGDKMPNHWRQNTTSSETKYHIIGDKMPHCRNKIKKKKSSSVGTDPKSFRKKVETGVKWTHLAHTHTHIYIHDISISWVVTDSSMQWWG